MLDFFDSLVLVMVVFDSFLLFLLRLDLDFRGILFVVLLGFMIVYSYHYINSVLFEGTVVVRVVWSISCRPIIFEYLVSHY